MKVLAGNLQESVYYTPEEEAAAGKPLEMKSSTVHGENAVSYISDEIGLHRVHNPSRNQLAVSLHCKRDRASLLLVFRMLTLSSSVYSAQCG